MNQIIIVLLKFLSKVLNILGHDGGNLIGKIAYKLNKNILKFFKINCPIIATTATNGKTMTNNLITYSLENAGYKVVSNKKGNNMLTGIISCLIKESNINGRINADFICFEVDESYVPIIFKTLNLDCLVVGNFFRDQLDRNGEVEHLIKNIEKFVENYDNKLVLNANDPNVLRLEKYMKNKNNIYYLKAEKYKDATTFQKDAGEGKYCPFCKTKLKYDYYQYSHIGNFTCNNCGFGSIKDYTYITNIDLKTKTFEINSNKFKTNYDNIYTVYNFGLAYVVDNIYGLSYDQIYKAFETFYLNNGRMEQLNVNNCKTVINLAKNPSGVNVSNRLLSQDENKKELLFVLNDNSADGKDVSWIYDIDFTSIADNKNVEKIILSGTRPYDIAIRVKYSNYPLDQIEVYEDINDAIKALYNTNTDKYIITNYTSLQPTRKALFFFKDNIDHK